MTFADTLLQWLWTFLSVFVTRGAFLFAIIYLVSRVAGVPARTRHLLWFAALCSLLALPVARAFIPSVAVGGPLGGRIESAVGLLLAPFSYRASVEGALGRLAPLVGVSLDAPRLYPVLLAVVGAYICGVLYCAIRAISAVLALKTLVAGGRHSARLERVAGDLAARLAVTREVPVLLHAEVTVPLACGVRCPRIIVPARAESWPSRRVRGVLVHELWHIQRRDPLLNYVSYVVCSLLWFFPPAWIARRFMRRDAEMCCDRRVLADGIHGTEYASTIMHVLAARTVVPLRAALGLLGGPGWLAERIQRIIHPPREAPRKVIAVAACVLALLLCSILSYQEAALPPARPLRVLFVGDTLGSYWDTPTLIAAIFAGFPGTRRPQIQYSDVGGTGLQAHISAADPSSAYQPCSPVAPSGAGLNMIHQGGWDVVVLEDGPWEPLTNDYQFLSSVTRLVTEARRVGASVLLLEPFSPGEGSIVFSGETKRFGSGPGAMQARLRRASGDVAHRLGIRQARVGDAFEWVRAHAPGMEIMENDKIHPNRRGAFLLSCVVAAALTGRDARDSRWLPSDGITPAEADTLRTAAALVSSD